MAGVLLAEHTTEQYPIQDRPQREQNRYWPVIEYEYGLVSVSGYRKCLSYFFSYRQ